jgi:hypothetical protein
MPESPTEGEVYAVRGSPGPAHLMRFDISVQFTWGPVLFENVRPVCFPYTEDSLEYDVVGAKPGSNVQISWRGDEARFWVPWLPVTTPCEDEP